MKPYGMKPFQWRDEEGGPCTKYTGSGYRKRRQDRRLMHKAERAAVKAQIRNGKQAD